MGQMVKAFGNARFEQASAYADPPMPRNRYGSILALVDQIVVSAVNFLTGAIIGRTCGKDEFGLYTLGFSLVFFIATVQNSLIWTPYMIFSPRLSDRERAKYAGSSFIQQIVLSAIAIVFLAAGALAPNWGIGSRELSGVLWALAAVSAFVFARESVRQVCFSRLKMGTAFLLDCAAAVAQIAGLGSLAWLGLLSASAAWWMAGAASCIAVLLWFVFARHKMIMRFSYVASDLRRNWAFGKWVFASGMAWALTTYLYPWILTGFHGHAAAGTWAACLGIVGITNPLVVGAQNFLGPSIAHRYAGGHTRQFQRHVVNSTFVTTAALLPIFVPLAIFGGRLVALVYGENYSDNGITVCWLTLSALAGAAQFALSRGLYALQRAKTDFWANAAGLIVLLVCGFWLAGSSEAAGAAFGLLLGNIIGLLVRCAGFQQALQDAATCDARKAHQGVQPDVEQLIAAVQAE
jgi:O-antigen/teichoic acid export membrane protein